MPTLNIHNSRTGRLDTVEYREVTPIVRIPRKGDVIECAMLSRTVVALTQMVSGGMITVSTDCPPNVRADQAGTFSGGLRPEKVIGRVLRPSRKSAGR